MWEIKLKIANLVHFNIVQFAGDSRDSKSTSGGLLCAFGSHTFVPRSWMCRKQSAVYHSSAESEILSLDAGLRIDGLPVLQFGECVCWQRCKSFFFFRILTLESLSSLTMFRPIFPTVLIQLNFNFSKTMRHWFKWSTKTKLTLRHVTRTHQVGLVWSFERVNLDNSISIKYVRTGDQLADILTRERAQRCSGSHCFNYGNYGNPMIQVMSAVFITNFFLALFSLCPRRWRKRWRKLYVLRKRGIDTLQHNWNQVACWLSKVAGTFNQEVLYQMKAEDNLLQIESPFQILRNKQVCETIRPIDNELSKMHAAEVHIFSEPVLCLGRSAMTTPEINFTERCKEHLEYCKDLAKIIVGQTIHFAFHIFFGAEPNEIMLKSDEWISARPRRRRTSGYSRDLPTSSRSHGNDERSSSFLTRTERR